VDGTYVYGIVRAGIPMPSPPAGIEGRPVATIERPPLAALVSDAPAGPVKASRKNLMAHSNVLQQVVAERTVLPMRFGVVMPSAEAAEDELLTDHQEDLVAQLDAFEGLVELDLKIVCPKEVQMRAVVAGRPDIAQLSREIRGKPADATYYERIRLGELVAQATAGMRDELVELVVAAVEPLAVRTDIGEPAHEQMLLNVAFLAERERVDEIDRAVRSVDEELAAGMNLKYVGPLPPYRFVEAAIEGAAWA
jgi:Gas vesicle synthesis protein GvpL/GvpF